MVDTEYIAVVEGTVSTDSFVSDGTDSQRFTISSTKADKTTVSVTVTDTNAVAVPWAVVDSFYDSNAPDAHYKIQTNNFNCFFKICE